MRACMREHTAGWRAHAQGGLASACSHAERAAHPASAPLTALAPAPPGPPPPAPTPAPSHPPCIQASRSSSACVKLSVRMGVKERGQARPARSWLTSSPDSTPLLSSTRVKMRYRFCCRYCAAANPPWPSNTAAGRGRRRRVQAGGEEGGREGGAAQLPWQGQTGTAGRERGACQRGRAACPAALSTLLLQGLWWTGRSQAAATHWQRRSRGGRAAPPAPRPPSFRAHPAPG